MRGGLYFQLFCCTKNYILIVWRVASGGSTEYTHTVHTIDLPAVQAMRACEHGNIAAVGTKALHGIKWVPPMLVVVVVFPNGAINSGIIGSTV